MAAPHTGSKARARIGVQRDATHAHKNSTRRLRRECERTRKISETRQDGERESGMAQVPGLSGNKELGGRQSSTKRTLWWPANLWRSAFVGQATLMRGGAR